MRKLVSLFALMASSAFGVDGDYTFTTIDQTWVDAFEVSTGRQFEIKADAQGPASQRAGWGVIYELDSHFVPSDAGKSLKEVLVRPEFNLSRYLLYTIEAGPSWPEADEDYLRIFDGPDGNGPASTRLDIRREVRADTTVPHSQIYLAFKADYLLAPASNPLVYGANGIDPSKGLQHVSASVDMFIPDTFSFQNTNGKFGLGLATGDHQADGGSTSVANQLGAATRILRGSGGYTRPYTYEVSRVAKWNAYYGRPLDYPEDTLNKQGWQKLVNPPNYTEIHDVPLPSGEWVNLEMEIFVNDPGSTNGYLRIWINGTKFGDYEDLVFRDGDHDFLLNAILINDMWQIHTFPGQAQTPDDFGYYWYGNYKIWAPDQTGDWAVDITSVDYGYKLTSSDTDVTLTFTNTSGGALTPTFSEDSAHYSIFSGATPGEIAAEGTTQVVLRYSPTTDAQHTGTLTGTGGDGITVPFTGISATLQSDLGPFNADAGTLVSPMVDGGAYISSPTADVGQAVYAVTIPAAGPYKVSTTVNGPSTLNNSFFAGWDAKPSGVKLAWHVNNLTTGFETREINNEGDGSYENPEFTPKIWNLTAGTHYLVINAREAGTQLQALTVVALTEVTQSQGIGADGLLLR